MPPIVRRENPEVSHDRHVHDLALGDERRALRATQPELDERAGADPASDRPFHEVRRSAALESGSLAERAGLLSRSRRFELAKPLIF